ncbi:SulP family inorganic anion transporter [Opitutales bacterium]|nr:SulP family inorganic anion transporter [Opitutales bacterium]
MKIKFKDIFTIQRDLRAGINVSLLAIPQGMAYALIAGLPLYFGLLASGIAAFLGGVLGGGRFITLGPTNATAVLLFGVFAQMEMVAPNGMLVSDALLILPSILLCTGLILIGAGTLKVSFLTKFISRTVITGYITAAALLIISNQVRSVIGMENPYPPGSNFFQSLIHIFKNIADNSSASIFLSFFTGITYIILNIKFKALPNVAISLVLGSIMGQYLIRNGYKVPCLQSFNSNYIPVSLPNFELSISNWEIIFQTSIALALLCLIEGLSIGKSLASRSGKRIKSDREALSFGVANIGCAFLSGMPASGSLTRSSLNVNSNAKSGFSNIITGSLVLIGFFNLGNLVHVIPVSALATLVVFIGISLIKKNQLITAIRSSRSDAVTFAVTFLVGLMFSLQLAIFVGVLTSLLLFLKKVAEPEMIEHGYNEQGEIFQISNKSKNSEPEVSIVHVEGELFFAAADLFYEQIRRVGEKRNIKVLILKLLNAHHLDGTSVLALEELLDYYKEKNCNILLCEVRKDAIRILRNSGVLSRINRQNIFPHIRSNPTLSTAKAIKRAKYLLSHNEAKVTIYANEKS